MKVKGFIKDISGIFRITKARNTAIKNANGKEIEEDKITQLARILHPGKVKGYLVDIKQESKDSKRLTFAVNEPLYFKAGSYLTIEAKIGESIITRPYSIVNSPLNARESKRVEIIVKDYPQGIMSHYLTNNTKIGDIFDLEVGLGDFNIDHLREKEHLTFIAGGVGITPFIALAKDVKERNLPYQITILYGSEDENDIIAKEELESLRSDIINIVYVISGKNSKYQGEKGFINRDIISKYAHKDSSYFFSGPEVMFDYIKEELKILNVDLRKVRYEASSISDISKDPDFKKELIDKEFNILVHQGLKEMHIKAKADESIATALERSGIRIHTSCRSGRCGVCRIKVIKGTYFVPQKNDKRRETDKEYNYVYSCSTYPTSDLEIKININ
ncbi:MAG: 2Fe-2S iron-sulfur cluster binding domain-containing protein [Bacilli bacterium]|nr:2Fe-2S iron-sulfur cluster binding domain-containing protein [Bacilli bacterium]